MEHTNTNTARGIYTHDGKHTTAHARLIRADLLAPTATGRGVRPIKRTRDGRRAARPRLLDATGAALAAASLTIRHAYRDAGMNARTLAAISAAIENGDAAAYGKMTATAYTAASAENGLNMIAAAIARAYGVTQRTAGHADAATRARLLYDALMTDTSGAALDTFGDAYAAIIAERGHAGAALFYGAAFRAGRAAARRVLYAARVKQTRTAASVEEWRDGERVGVVSVPTAWDVYTYEEIEYLRTERDAIAAAAGTRYAARFIDCRLRGLTLAETAERLGVCLRTCKSVAAAVRAAYNATHGTAYGSAHERARQA